MTAQEFGRVTPLVVVLDCRGARVVVGVTQVAFAITHDQQAFDAQIIAACFQVGEVFLVLGLVHKELIDIFDGLNSEFFFGDPWEIQIRHIFGFVAQGIVQRPLGQGNFERGFRAACFVCQRIRSQSGGASDCGRILEKLASVCHDRPRAGGGKLEGLLKSAIIVGRPARRDALLLVPIADPVNGLNDLGVLWIVLDSFPQLADGLIDGSTVSEYGRLPMQSGKDPRV